jgi:hypothetical protein
MSVPVGCVPPQASADYGRDVAAPRAALVVPSLRAGRRAEEPKLAARLTAQELVLLAA